MHFEFLTTNFHYGLPGVSIYLNGSLVFTNHLARQIDVAATPYCLLGYDKNDSLIALKLCAIKSSGCRKLSGRKRGDIITLSGCTFIKHFNLSRFQGKTYPAKLQDDMIIVSLAEADK